MMEGSRKSHSSFSYVRQLADAGWKGVSSTLQHVDGPFFSPPLKHAAWTPMAAGAALGVLGVRYARNARSKSDVAIGGAAGTAVGFIAAAIWASRHVTRAAARSAARRINAVRDAHWLELNPIDYA
jgi:hypothetical protein